MTETSPSQNSSSTGRSDAPGGFAEAVALDGERIVAVGSNVAVDALHGPTTRVVNLTGRLNSKVFAATCCGFAADRSVSRSSPPTPRTCPRRLGARQRLGHRGVSRWPADRSGPRLGVVDDRRSWRTRTTAPRGSTRWRSQSNARFSVMVPSFRNQAGRRLSISAPCKLRC
jgi:hypothetical protein